MTDETRAPPVDPAAAPQFPLTISGNALAPVAPLANPNEQPPAAEPEAPPSPAFETGLEMLRRPGSLVDKLKQDASASWDFVKAAATLDFPEFSIYQRLKRQTFTPDPSFQLPDPDTAEGQKYFAGIPAEYISSFAHVASAAEADYLKGTIKARQDAAAELASYHGVIPMVSRMGVSLFDPIADAAMLATGGLGEAANVARIGGLVAKTTRITNAVRIGLEAGLANASLSAIAEGASPADFDWHDVAWAGLMGLGMGAGAGALFKPTELQAVRQALGKNQADMAGDEARSVLEQAGKPIPHVDTLSAARTDFATAPVSMPADTLTARTEPAAEIAQSAFPRAHFWTLAGKSRGSSDPWIRNTFGPLFGDRVGPADASAVNTVGADEIRSRILDTYHARLNRTLAPAFKEWGKETGNGFWSRLGQTAQEQFNKEVGEVVVGATERSDAFPAVVRAADKVSELHADVLHEMQRAGVEGFESIPENENYLSRFWDFAGITRASAKYGQHLTAVFAKAIRNAQPNLDEATAGTIANSFLRKLRQKGAGMDTELMHGIRVDDAEYLRSLMKDSGVEGSELDHAMQQVQDMIAARQKSTGGPHAQHRLNLDMHSRFEIHNNMTGNTDTLRLLDLTDHNAERAFLRYLSPAAGRIALARSGFKSEAAFKRAILELKDRLSSQGKSLRLASTLEKGHDLIMGRSLEKDPSGAVAQTFRIARQYNVARMMNQVAFASIQDLAGSLSWGYLRNTLAHVPELGAMLRRRADGTFSHELYNEIEQWLGQGVDTINSVVFSRSDGLGAMSAEEWAGARSKGWLQGVGNWADHWSRQASRFTGLTSGMAGLQNMLQRGTTASIVTKFANEGFTVKQLRYLGLSDEMAGRIRSQFQHIVDTKPSLIAGRKVKALNMDNWTDLDARDAFVQAVRREARRIVQQQDIGMTSPVMHGAAAKALLQFRSFVLGAWENHLLHPLRQRDMQVFTEASLALLLSTASVASQTYLRTIGQSSADQERAMNWKRLALQGISRMNQVSILPQIVDTISELASHDPVFGFRSTGLATNLFTGSPSVDLGQNLVNVLRTAGGVATHPGYQFSRDDLNALFRSAAFGNQLPLVWLHNEMAQGLPKHSLPQYAPNEWGLDKP